MENSKNKKKTGIVNRLLLIAQIIIAVILAGIVIKAGIIPARYLILAIIVLALLAFLVFVLGRRKSSAIRAIAAILSIFVIGMSIFGIVYVTRIDATLSKISDAQNTETESMIVIVRSDDAATSLSDTAQYKYATAGQYTQESSGSSDTSATTGTTAAAATSVNQEYLGEMVSDIESQIGSTLAITQYSNPVEACRALTGNDVDAVICSSVYPDLMEDVDPGYSSAVKTIYTKNFTTKSDSVSEDASTESAADETVSDVTKDSFNVYISGIDVSGPISTVSRSDVNIIMTVNPTTHKILLTTTPRDYFVYIPGISGDSRDKLTHSGIYGINASIATLENLYGIKLNYYVRVNFDSLINIVDTLGGIDVNSDYDFSTDTGKTSYHFTKGINHMNGEQALAFSRERHSFQSGDNQRGKDQEAVLTAIIEKMQTSAVLTNASEVLNVIQQSAQTSLSREDMNKLIRYQISENPSWDTQSQAATGTGDMQVTYSMPGTKLYVMWPDDDVVKTLAENIKSVEEGK